jgi:hypothetical protein
VSPSPFLAEQLIGGVGSRAPHGRVYGGVRAPWTHHPIGSTIAETDGRRFEVANALPVESAPATIARSGLWARLQSSISIGVVLVVIVALAYVIGAKIHNLNATRAVGVFAVGVVSFFGTLSLAHRSSPNSPHDSSEVRLAVTAAFMMVYFAALGIFLFSINTVGSFGQNLMNNMTSLFGVVVGFYFASSAVVEYSRSRERERTGAAPAPSSSDLEAEVRSLRQLVSELTAERDRERAEGDRSVVSTETGDD